MIIKLKYYRDHSLFKTLLIIFKKVFLLWNKKSNLYSINRDLEIRKDQYPALKTSSNDELKCTSCELCKEVLLLVAAGRQRVSD